MPPGRHHWALIGFSILTLICTYPIAVELGNAVQGWGDPLLNSWILAWETHSLAAAGQVSFFDTNIFYPHRNTLAYSEFLIPQLFLALPVILSTGNPILAHNIVLLVSLLATAMGTYWLAFRITRSRSASFAAGLILAFCPFMFSHLQHVQIVFAAGIPLTFLLLCRWLESSRTRDAVLLGLVYAIQVLANAYYAVYLTFFAGLFFLVQLVRSRAWVRRRFWGQALLAGLIAAALIGPFYVRYFQLRQEMGFQRVLPPPTPVTAYLAAPEANRLYGEITAAMGRSEAYLFPGFVATGLALIGLYQWARHSPRRHPPSAKTFLHGATPWWRFRVLDGLIGAIVILILLLGLGMKIDTHLGPVPLRVASLRNPILFLILLSVARLWVRRHWPEHSRPLGVPASGWTYPLILLSAGVLALGTEPYLFLYRWVPGFSSLRAVPRIHVMFMFALAILAAQGMAFLLRHVAGRRRVVLAMALPLLIVMEYFSAPLPVEAAPRPSEFPAVQQWLAEQDEDLVFIAYPLRVKSDILDLYYSTQHWRRMVNGFSGFLPPLFLELASKGQIVPSQGAVRDLQSLGVDHVLVDLGKYRDRRRQRLRSTLEALPELEEVAVFDRTWVYRVVPQPAHPRPSLGRQSDLRPLDVAHLALRASIDSESLNKTVDGNRRTRWRAPMVAGQWLQMEWRETAKVAALELEISGLPHDYPRGYRVETSEDGDRWHPATEEPEYHPPIQDFLQPADFVLRFEWPPRRARFLRFIQTGESAEHLWSVVEIRVLSDPS